MNLLMQLKVMKMTEEILKDKVINNAAITKNDGTQIWFKETNREYIFVIYETNRENNHNSVAEIKFNKILDKSAVQFLKNFANGILNILP